MPNNQSNKSLDINFAIPETKRPPIYTSMKYWGKKPHNVWGEYIATYVPEDGIFLDPFAGSGMSGIEAVKAGRKAICLDANPLTTFIFDVYCTRFNSFIFEQEVKSIFNAIESTHFYREYYCYVDGFYLHNVKYDRGQPYEVCFSSIKGKERFERTPNEIDIKKINDSKEIDIKTRYPNQPFRCASAYSNSFLSSIGTTYDCLFTRKNLALLSMIYEQILMCVDDDVKKQLLFAFIQTVHLCCKMCVPRSKKTKRDYSTSWGRSAYFSASKSMEMNPLLVFYSNCIGKQSVSSSLTFLQKYIGQLKGKNITNESKINLKEDYDIWYGIKDSRHLSDYIEKNLIDFVLTDPPYGGLVPYLDLSYIWLAWLEIYDPIYAPNYAVEITVNANKTLSDFRTDMTQVLSEIDKVSKRSAKVVLTFNNKDSMVWKSLLGSIIDADYRVEKVIHQQNLRSGESNVADKYGTSSTDFYIRCIKNCVSKKTMPITNLQKYICDTAENIISSRGEPTPYQILFNGIMAILSVNPDAFVNFDADLILALQDSKRFCTIENKESLSGNYWWIKDKAYDANNQMTLSNRVKKSISEIFDKVTSIEQVDLLKIIYREFPNGLSPDSVILEKIIQEYAYRKGARWQKK